MRSHLSALKFWLLPVSWMVVIFSASGDTASMTHSSTLFEPLMRWLFPWLGQASIEELHYLFRKGAHMAEFSVLALLLWQALRHTLLPVAPGWRWSQAGLALVIVLAYAASDEIHQSFIPGRSALLSDVVIDTLGGAAGLGLLWLVGRLGKRW